MDVLVGVLVVIVVIATAGWVRSQRALGRARVRMAELEADLAQARAAEAPLPRRIRRSGRMRAAGRPSSRSVPRVMRTAEKAVQVVAESAQIVRDHGVGGLVAASIDDLNRWVADALTEIVRSAAPDGTVTIFFSDIEGSTALNESLGDRGFVKLLADHDTLVRTAVESFDGHVVKTQGDGFMVAFADPSDAIRAALDVQASLAVARGRLRTHEVRVRIGLHRGVVVARDGDYFGRNVALAARVASAAAGGEVLVSDDLRAAVIDSSEFVFVDARETELKGFDGTHLLWQVDGLSDGLGEGLS